MCSVTKVEITASKDSRYFLNTDKVCRIKTTSAIHSPETEEGEHPVSGDMGRDTPTSTYRQKRRNDNGALFEVGFRRARLPLADPEQQERETSQMWLFPTLVTKR